VARQLAACHHAAFDLGDRSCAEAEAHRTVAAIQPTQAVPDEMEAWVQEQAVAWVQEQTMEQMA